MSGNAAARASSHPRSACFDSICLYAEKDGFKHEREHVVHRRRLRQRRRDHTEPTRSSGRQLGSLRKPANNIHHRPAASAELLVLPRPAGGASASPSVLHPMAVNSSPGSAETSAISPPIGSITIPEKTARNQTGNRKSVLKGLLENLP